MRCGKNYRPAVAFTYGATFNLDQKLTPDYFFLKFIHQWTLDRLLSFQEEKKNTNSFSIVQGSAREKTYKLLSISGFTLLIREKNYETAVTYMNQRCKLLVRWRQLLIRWKKYKWSNRPKKGSKPNFLFARSSRYNYPTFYEKKIPTSQSL